MHTERKILYGTLATLVLIVVAGCIKIQTGQTSEEAVASSETRANRIRAKWAGRFNAASPTDMVEMLTDHVESVCGGYINYGRDVVIQWREGSAGRGQEIDAAEMQQVVEGWTKTEKPIMKAWEDNLEYGFERIKETGFFDETMMRSVNQLVDHFYKLYSGVFFPSGTVDDYETRLYELNDETERVIEELRKLVDRY